MLGQCPAHVIVPVIPAVLSVPTTRYNAPDQFSLLLLQSSSLLPLLPVSRMRSSTNFMKLHLESDGLPPLSDRSGTFSQAFVAGLPEHSRQPTNRQYGLPVQTKPAGGVSLAGFSVCSSKLA